ncbi:MAG: 2-C-methyl-D-erythritol 2,4-cyclodiphosphate synthase [Gammaproteobacteria bacterium]|nr:2-C-methyl-D-erythritol 2,4-cyclodiphosphate synthase [Gammaproteobacteria bacterium]MCW9030173.1 2-C-methyl-D-erythritol 2,4-cyclodiphosphate synthase [Gammaproteobacteria bacterium]
MRIGQGYDAHKFKDSGKLILGGVEIPYEKGMEAHSDGDVVIHALCDALLGAMALGDIGKHFPDTDDSYKGIDSRILLKEVMNKVRAGGMKLGNADITVIAQAPKLAPHIQTMRQILAHDMSTALNNVSVKATTTERMGFTGRAEGIAVTAIVFLV